VDAGPYTAHTVLSLFRVDLESRLHSAVLVLSAAVDLCQLFAGSPRIDGSQARFPISKLKLDNLFLQWLSMTESQNLVSIQTMKWLSHRTRFL